MNRLFGSRAEPEEELPLVATADEELRPQVVQIFALVGEAIAGATHALLSGDRELAKRIVDKDIVIDELVNTVVDTAEMRLLEDSALNQTSAPRRHFAPETASRATRNVFGEVATALDLGQDSQQREQPAPIGDVERIVLDKAHFSSVHDRVH